MLWSNVRRPGGGLVKPSLVQTVWASEVPTGATDTSCNPTTPIAMLVNRIVPLTFTVENNHPSKTQESLR